ncbi:MAG: DNA-directed RNA polymerase subunit beta, partial [Alphaproteobacteria bacterium]|nr:DNA-directed RNA polymerase subunit beta [Alphaproteobacteria bacterium]
RIFSRRGVDKDERTLAIEQAEKERLHKDIMVDEHEILEHGFYDRLHDLLVGHTAASAPRNVKPGVKIDQKLLSQCTHRDWRRFSVTDDERQREIETLVKRFDERIKRLKRRFDDKVEKLEQGTELPPGSLKIVKVFIAVKRKLQPGDKMAGRHGNKGVISKIVPVEDMPHLEDGTPVDVILNPLGVPSRMNIGQILETHIGWGASGLGRKIGALVDECQRGGEFKRLRESLAEAYGQDAESAAEVRELSDESVVRLGESLRAGLPVSTPVFDGAREEDIVSLLEEAGLHSSGQVTLTDGRTGEKFERSVTVGYMYVLKLHHLVDEKIHARSTGQYSLVTQQPMGGKAQFGGQRFGEMEVWALEAYGAAYTLQEILTVKSDDVAGRSKAYEAIAHGHDEFETGIPESFNVLVKELMSLCLNIDLRQFRPYA